MLRRSWCSFPSPLPPQESRRRRVADWPEKRHCECERCTCSVKCRVGSASLIVDRRVREREGESQLRILGCSMIVLLFSYHAGHTDGCWTASQRLVGRGAQKSTSSSEGTKHRILYVASSCSAKIRGGPLRRALVGCTCSTRTSHLLILLAIKRLERGSTHCFSSFYLPQFNDSDPLKFVGVALNQIFLCFDSDPLSKFSLELRQLLIKRVEELALY